MVVLTYLLKPRETETKMMWPDDYSGWPFRLKTSEQLLCARANLLSVTPSRSVKFTKQKERASVELAVCLEV